MSDLKTVVEWMAAQPTSRIPILSTKARAASAWSKISRFLKTNTWVGASGKVHTSPHTLHEAIANELDTYFTCVPPKGIKQILHNHEIKHVGHPPMWLYTGGESDNEEAIRELKTPAAHIEKMEKQIERKAAQRQIKPPVKFKTKKAAKADWINSIIG